MKAQGVALLCITIIASGCANKPMPDTYSKPAYGQPAPAVAAAQHAQIETQSTEQPESFPLTQSETEQPATDPNSQAKTAHLDLVANMIEQNNAYAALAHLDSYDNKWGADTTSKLYRADALRKTKQFDAAEALYKSILGQGSDTKAWYGLGKTSIAQGDLNAAEIRFEKSVEADPNNVQANSDLGLIYLLNGKKQESFDTLTKASELSNSDPKVLVNLALWGLVYDDYNKALEIADQLQWPETTRNKLMAKAGSIKRRIQSLDSSK